MGDALSMGTMVLRGLIAAPSLRKVKTQREDMSVEGQTAVALGRTAPRIPQTAGRPAVRLIRAEVLGRDVEPL